MGFTLIASLSQASDSRVLLEGDFIQGGLIIGSTEEGSDVSLDGKSVLVDDTGFFIFGFGRDHAESAELIITFADKSEEIRHLTVNSREYEIQRIEGIPSKYVTPPPEVLERIKQEGQKKRQARNRNGSGTGYKAKFEWPLTGPITGVYGSQRVFNGEPKRPHFGVDVAAPNGADVVAPAPGTVTLAEADMYYEGGLIFLDHGMGLISVFMHLSGVSVADGDVVAQGDAIGKVGATGRSSGAHLDWRMFWTDQRIDPQLLVGLMEVPDQPRFAAD